MLYIVYQLIVVNTRFHQMVKRDCHSHYSRLHYNCLLQQGSTSPEVEPWGREDESLRTSYKKESPGIKQLLPILGIWLFEMSTSTNHLSVIPVFLILSEIEFRPYFSLNWQIRNIKLKNLRNSSLWTCWYIMDISRNKNKSTYFFMISAWLCRFNILISRFANTTSFRRT